MSDHAAGSTPTPSGAAADVPGQEGGLLRAAGLVGILSIIGSLLGFLRDVTIASLFGATGDTDAFFVAWTIPETATPLLMEGAMAAVLVPLFSHELVQRGHFRRALGGLLLPLFGVLAALTAVTAVAAPVAVTVLAPGLEDPETAVRSFRVASLTILFLGLSGYLAAALRARNVFGWPGSIFIAYNVGILSTILLLHEQLGIYSAAIGLAVGAGLMVAIQTPAFVRTVGLPRPTVRLPVDLLQRLSSFIPLATYTLTRHAQVFIERFAGSLLAVGTITHLNYATKIAQIPMLLSLTVAAVTLPVLSRTAAKGSVERLRSLVERNYRWVIFLVVPATAFFVAFAGETVGLLFERGAFTSEDTTDTASILRVYCLGLVGQVLVGTTVQALVAVPGRTWLPARAALLGLLLTAVLTAAATPLLGVEGIALANAAGISLMALLLILSLAKRGIALDRARAARHLARSTFAAGLAAIIGLGVESVVHKLFVAETPERIAVILLAGGSLLASYVVITHRLGMAEGTDVLRFLRKASPFRLGAASAEAPEATSAEAPTRTGGAGEVVRRQVRARPPWILMYHAIEPYEDDPWLLCVSPERFRRQMRWLARRGLRGVSIRELRRARSAGDHEGMVGLTFDDGYAGFPKYVIPILEEHGFSATVFATAGRLGGWNEWDPGPRRALLTPEQLVEVASAGIEVGSHGLMHARLPELRRDELTREVAESRRILEDVTGSPVEGFCYPYGIYDEAIVTAVREAGYEYACAVSPAERDDDYLMPRAFIGERDGELRLSLKLAAHRLKQWRR